MVQIMTGAISSTCDTHGEIRNVCKIFVGNPQGKRSRERTKCRWEIKMCLTEMVCGVSLTDSGCGPVTTINLPVP